MAGNTTTLVLAGDADSLRRAVAAAEAALNDMQNATDDAANRMDEASNEGGNLTERMGHLGSAVSGATDAIGSIGESLNALNDIQNMAANRAQRQARLTADVEQAQIDQRQAAEDLRQANLDLSQSYLDGEQALIDGKQAAIDIKQATLDAEIAQKEYNQAVKEHGANSEEAKQAAIDLEQTTADLAQAQLDQKQAQQDATQYAADGRQAMIDATQAVRDGKDAQLDLNDAMTEAKPGALKEWAGYLEMVTPLISAVVGVMGLVTAAQWLWNASLWASPITWIVIGVVALVAVIVLIATKTTWFQDLWRVTWSGIKTAAEAVGTWFRDVLWGVYIKGTWDGIVAATKWLVDNVVGQFNAWKGVAVSVFNWFMGIPEMIRKAFSAVTGFILAPFRAAFNQVSSAWNNTVGRLSWSVPSWVPFIGGNSFSAPRLPQWHTGGHVSGALGAEVLGVLKAGERVVAGNNGADGSEITVVVELVGDGVLKVVRTEVGRRGGNVQRAFGGNRG